MKCVRILGISLLIYCGIALAQEAVIAEPPFTAGTWTPVKKNPPAAVAHAMLLSDGSVLVNSYFFSAHADPWYRLVPDNTGSYINGTWVAAATLPAGYNPVYFASQVLPTGQVAIFGGEYNNGDSVWTTLGALYQPLLNRWVPLTPPAGWATIGDAQSIVLPNGKMMLANCCTRQEAIMTLTGLTPTWTSTGTGKADSNDEEGWTMLPGGKVLTVDAYASGGCCGKGFQIYTPSTGAWTTPTGNTAVNLVDPSSSELGPGALLPNGTVFYAGGTTNNAIYTVATGKWAAAPSFGDGLDMADGPATVLPNGNLLLDTSPGVFNNGTIFFEWDGTALHRTTNPQNAAIDSSYNGNTVLLPNGQVLFTDFSNLVQIYTPVGTPCAGCAPTITSVASTLTHGVTGNAIKGTQFTGMTQGSFYGDDNQADSNFPLVRITDAAGHIVYCRTHSWAPGVATGKTIVSAQFDVPSTIALGPAKLVVVANGIPSAAVSVTIN